MDAEGTDSETDAAWNANAKAWLGEWQALLHGLIAERVPAGGEAPEAAAAALRDLITTWREGLERIAPGDASLVGLTEQLAAAQHAAMPWLAILASPTEPVWPQLGPLQNDQARSEALAKAFGEYRNASLQLADAIIALVDDCLAAFATSLESQSAQPTDLQARIELWAQVAEARYQSHLQDGPLATRLAALANAWAECRLRARELFDPLVSNLGIPSQSQMDDTQAHLNKLQRRVSSEVERLQGEIDGVRRELARHGRK